MRREQRRTRAGHTRNAPRNWPRNFGGSFANARTTRVTPSVRSYRAMNRNWKTTWKHANTAGKITSGGDLLRTMVLKQCSKADRFNIFAVTPLVMWENAITGFVGNLKAGNFDDVACVTNRTGQNRPSTSYQVQIEWEHFSAIPACRLIRNDELPGSLHIINDQETNARKIVGKVGPRSSGS